MNYLIEKCHEQIGMIDGVVSPVCRIHRVSGYREALETNGIQFREEFVALGMPVMEHGFSATKVLLSKHPEISALFCYNDLLAMGAVQSCKKMGLKIPEDIAIVGFDNISFSSMVSPALTTIHVDKYEIGKRSASLLLQMLKEPDQEYPVQFVDVELIERESV